MHTNRIDTGTLDREIEQGRTRLGHAIDAIRDRQTYRDLSTELGERFHDWEEPAVRFVQRHPISVGLAAMIASAMLARRSRNNPAGWLHKTHQPTARELVTALLANAATATRRTNDAARESTHALRERAASMAGDTFHRAADVTRHAGQQVRYGGQELHEQIIGLARREPLVFGVLAMLLGSAVRSAFRRRHV
jgi:hypothetical protein